MKIAPGFCDDDNNNAFCSWDGGDCCTSPPISRKRQFVYCKVCACLDCTDKDFRTCVVSGKRDKCVAPTTPATTSVARDKCVKVVQGKCGFLKGKGDGEYSMYIF